MFWLEGDDVVFDDGRRVSLAGINIGKKMQRGSLFLWSDRNRGMAIRAWENYERVAQMIDVFVNMCNKAGELSPFARILFQEDMT